MALESVCGLNNAPYMRRSNFLGSEEEHFIGELERACLNMRNSFTLAAPPFENPVSNFIKLQNNSAGVRVQYEHGTTTLAFKYQGGVVIAVDSRATGGQFVGSQTMKKVVEINEYMLGTLAGGAADCVYWDRVLAKECRMHELVNHHRVTVAAASKIMCNVSQDYKGMGLSMGMMLAGYDMHGPQLYYIDSDGARATGSVFSVGSGSTFAFGVLDSGYRFDLKTEEAIELGQRAIFHATCKDAFSGGIVRVYHITEKGWECISNNDCMELYYKYADEDKQKMEGIDN